LKLRAATAFKAYADVAMRILGADAMCEPTGEWQTLFLTAPSLSIRGGTDEIQRNIVGERVLGLPAEPRVDRGIPFRALPH
jgi:alkylation response protein AidB-like acyl-CoA dehydrogenase